MTLHSVSTQSAVAIESKPKLVAWIFSKPVPSQLIVTALVLYWFFMFLLINLQIEFKYHSPQQRTFRLETPTLRNMGVSGAYKI